MFPDPFAPPIDPMSGMPISPSLMGNGVAPAPNPFMPAPPVPAPPQNMMNPAPLGGQPPAPFSSSGGAGGGAGAGSVPSAPAPASAGLFSGLGSMLGGDRAQALFRALASNNPAAGVEYLSGRRETAKTERQRLDLKRWLETPKEQRGAGRPDLAAMVGVVDNATLFKMATEKPTPHSEQGKYWADVNSGLIPKDMLGQNGAMPISDKDRVDRLNTLGDDYRQDDAVKSFQTIRSSYQTMRAGAQQRSGIGDMAIVYGYMKMLDPTSVVRETEYANAENAGGVPETIRNMWNRVLAGDKLSDEMRAKFVTSGESIYNERAGNLGRTNSRFARLAKVYGVDPSLILEDPQQFDNVDLFKLFSRRAMTHPAKGSISPEKIAEMAQKHGTTEEAVRARLQKEGFE